MTKEAEESGYKSHHYVPVTYQKRWTNKSEWNNKKQSILVYHRENKKIIKTVTKDQAQKKNLYTKTTNLESIDPKSLEKFIFPIFESRYNETMERTFDKDSIPIDNKDINNLTLFILVQCIRSSKSIYLEEERRKLAKDKFGKDFLNNFFTEDETINEFIRDNIFGLEIVILRDLPITINKANLQILVAPKNHNFITSDNAGSIWWKEGEDFYIMEYSNPDFKENDRFFLCPLSPKYCGMVRLSPLIDNNLSTEIIDIIEFEERAIPYEFIDLDVNDLKTINKMLVRASDKVLFFSKESDIQYLS